MSGTCQNMFRMIYFEAEDIFQKYFWTYERDQSVTDHPSSPYLLFSSCLMVQLMVVLLSSLLGTYLARELLDTVWLELLHSD